MLKRLNEQMIDAAFLLAKRMEIPYQLIIPKNESKPQLEKLKELAKLWPKVKLEIGEKGEEEEKEKSGEQQRKKGKSGERKEWGGKTEDKENAGKILQHILGIMDDGNILALNKLTKGNDAFARLGIKKLAF